MYLPTNPKLIFLFDFPFLTTRMNGFFFFLCLIFGRSNDCVLILILRRAPTVLPFRAIMSMTLRSATGHAATVCITVMSASALGSARCALGICSVVQLISTAAGFRTRTV